MGIIASPKKQIDSVELIEKIHNICFSPIRYSSGGNKIINKIAIVGGSGTSFIPNVLASGCDAFITADVTYHQFHSVKDKLLLIDVGHYEMEQFVPKGIANALNGFLTSNKIKFETSKILTNPIRYFPNGNDYLNKQNEILK
jgi:putative NIF3 family GTP cyclohydrolase 1 type 2